jgi:hypothetical protein
MKKTFIIALCCMALSFAACKPDNPTPSDPVDDVDYTEKYVGNYNGTYEFTILTMNNEPVTNMVFPMDNIGMVITKGEGDNAITATVTVDNETRQTSGTATIDKADFELLHLIIDKPDQGYRFDLDLKMEGNKIAAASLNIAGTFTGNGTFVFMGETQILDEVSGNMNGQLGKQ